jgi:putative ABC transport system permease protein
VFRDNVHDLLFRVRALFRRQTQKAQHDEELRFHLEQQVAKYVDSGMDPAEAIRQARLQFGSLDQVKEEYWEARGVGLLESVVQDVRYAGRTLRRSPWFTFCAVLTLALGIGANTAIFTVINSVLLNPLPYRDPQELVAMKQNDSQPNLQEIQRANHSFVSGGGINTMAMDFTGGPEPVQLRGGLVDAGFLQTLGVAPLMGRLIDASEDVKGGPPNVVVSYGFWKNFLHADQQVLGKSIPLSGNPYTVIGVMPRDFNLPRERADLFVSIWVEYPSAAAEREVHFMHSYWRLKPGVTLSQAQADVAEIDRRLSEQYPDGEKDRHSLLRPLREAVVGDVRTGLLVLFGAVGLVLLIACANFAMLLIARAVARQRELMTRAALGAGAARLIRQRLTESILLALAGGAAGLLFAWTGTGLLLALKPAALQRFSTIHMDGRVFLAVFGVSLLTGVAFGFAPAWSAARANVAESLRDSARVTSAGRSRHRLRSVLVASEFALALVLLVGAGLLIKAFWRLRSVDPGFNPANVTTVYLPLAVTRYPQIPLQNNFRRELLAKVNSLPGVESGMITDVPLAGNFVGHRVVIDGRPTPEVGTEPVVQTLSVMGDYFRVMQIGILAGRDFTPMDREEQPLVAIVNETFVRQLLPGQNPIGARIDWIRRDEPHKWMTIVGVAADVKHSGLNEPVDPAIYAPFAQNDEAWRRWTTLVVRTQQPTAEVVDAMKKQVWSLDSQIPVSDIESMDELMALSLAQQRFNLVLLVTFAGLALLLAAVGIYGMMAYRVSQRTHEIGVYVALGAQRVDVLRMIMRDAALLAGIGMCVGVAGAVAVTRLMTTLLFEVTPTDPGVFSAVVLVLSLVALAACYIPARRALSVSPVVALRCE